MSRAWTQRCRLWGIAAACLAAALPAIAGDAAMLPQASDLRAVSPYRVLPATLSRIVKLLPVSYLDPAQPGRTRFGFIAQNTMTVFPELVSMAGDASGTLSVDYTGLIAPTIRALQELAATSDNDVAKLHEEVQIPRLRLDALERANNARKATAK